jgi:2-keto-4-pentenoate hydratase/2-oxohepta-3-ene-1,7-dioic acid hydratase in catechol pathway
LRIVQFRTHGARRVGVVVGEAVLDPAAALQDVLEKRDGYAPETAARLADQRVPGELADFLALGDSAFEEVRELLEHAEDGHWSMPTEEVSFEPPLSPSRVIYATGYNYAEHAAEASARTADVPNCFIRTHDTLVGHRENVVRPVGVSTQLDFEVELAVVIGKPCHRVAQSDALDHVAGFTILNDGSVRDYQKRTPNPTAGKNFHRSGSLGPWIVTLDEFADPEALDIGTRVNGAVMQSANTREMTFDVRTTISYFSEFAVLQPGDVIATGTPAGVGFRREPQVFLVPDDHIQFEIEGIGILENWVVDEVPAAVGAAT